MLYFGESYQKYWGFKYLFNELQSHNRQAATTRVEIQGNIAAAGCVGTYCFGVGYGFSPDALHLSLTVYDAYTGISTIDGQPRGCASAFVCLNSVPIDGMKSSPNAWGPFILSPPSGMSPESFAESVRANSASWKNDQTPYRASLTSNTFIQWMLTPIYGQIPRLNFSPYQAPGYEGKP